MNFPPMPLSSRKALLAILIGVPMPASAQTSNTIQSNFNGTVIAANRYILFNAHITSASYTGAAYPASNVMLHVKDIHVNFTSGSANYNITLPNADMLFSASQSSATGSYTNGKWVTAYPKSVTANPFISALMWPVPATGLPGGINPVSMTASFYTNVGTISTIKWQWSAAVYTLAPDDPNDLGMLFVEGARHSGTPMNYISYCVGGARGGGAGDTTGSWSATGTVSNLVVLTTPPYGALNFANSFFLKGVSTPFGWSITRDL